MQGIQGTRKEEQHHEVCSDPGIDQPARSRAGRCRRLGASGRLAWVVENDMNSFVSQAANRPTCILPFMATAQVHPAGMRCDTWPCPFKINIDVF